MKRAVYKAIGMPMRKKRKATGPIKDSGKFQGKSNALGQGGRAAQLKARGVPGGVIGNLARAAQAAPGQKNFHKKKIAKKASMTKSQMMAMKKRKGSDALVKAPMDSYVRKTAKKGTMGLVKSPKANRTQTMRRKVAKKGTSFGDESIQGAKQERAGESAKGFKRKSSKKG